MAFRVLVIGGRQRFDYARLRDALDTLLANHSPDVELLTTGGPGVPSLAACYAAERGLAITTVPLDYTTHRGDAVEWRDARLVGGADAAVLVGDATEVRGLVGRAYEKGLRVVVVMAAGEQLIEPEPTSPEPWFRGLPGGWAW